MKKDGFISFCVEKRLVLILVSALSIALMFVMATQGDEMDAMYLRDDDAVVGIIKDSPKRDVVLQVTAEKDGTKVERSVTLLGKDDGKTANQEDSRNSISTKDEIDLAITRMVRTLNAGRESELELPSDIDESIALKWDAPSSGNTWMLPIFIPLLVMVFLYRGKMDSANKEEETLREKITSEIPAFNNKLVLLLGSGLVYEESLRRLAEEGEREGSLTLSGILYELKEKSEKTNRDATYLLADYARERKIGDLKRMVAIILDNRKKGTNLIPKLAMEGELLWEKRKKKAEETGRLAESKLTIPLGIMLIALLIVTAGPAILQI